MFLYKTLHVSYRPFIQLRLMITLRRRNMQRFIIKTNTVFMIKIVELTALFFVIQETGYTNSLLTFIIMHLLLWDKRQAYGKVREAEETVNDLKMIREVHRHGFMLFNVDCYELRDNYMMWHHVDTIFLCSNAVTQSLYCYVTFPCKYSSSYDLHAG